MSSRHTRSCRDGALGLRAFLAAERIVLAASKLGKWKMTFQVIGLSFLFIGNESIFLLPEDLPVFMMIGMTATYIALAFSLVSAYFYISNFWNLLGEKIMAEQKGSDANDTN